MPDITMCKGDNCSLKESCYRFTANPNKKYQSYFSEIPYNEETRECNYFTKAFSPNTSRQVWGNQIKK
jgi:hypothetical protein